MSFQKKSNPVSSRSKLHLIGIGIGVAGLVGVSVLVILWPRDSCGGIFEQTAPRLEAHLEIIKNKGSFAVSHEKIQELSESAQKVGLHLKTCCSVLERGKLDPEQFQQCIDTASTYDRHIALVAQQVEEAAEAKEMGAEEVSQVKIGSINQAIQTAMAEAESFGRQVVQVKPCPQLPEETAGSPSIQVSSQIAGVSAELVEFSRFENTITLKLRFVNTGKKNRVFYPSGHGSTPTGSDSYLLDEVTGKRYKGTSHAGSVVSVPAGGSIVFWVKYLMPEGDKPRYLSAVLKDGILLEHLKAP